MSRKRSQPRGKKINPHFWVFCEGKTEEAYIGLLRSKYRLPIEIISKVSGHSISANYIKKYKRGKPVHEKDKDFLIYDSDVPEVLEKLKKIPGVKLIASNPSIELWFLLHYKNQRDFITEEKCIGELKNRNKVEYKKGVIDEKLRSKLNEKHKEACARAKNLVIFGNPSTNMYELIDELENTKADKLQ